MGGGVEGQGAGGAGILPCKLQQLLHHRVLVGPVLVTDVQRSEAMLLQHRGDGGGPGEVEERRVHTEDGRMDGGAEEEEDIPSGFFATFLAGFWWKYAAG